MENEILSISRRKSESLEDNLSYFMKVLQKFLKKSFRNGLESFEKIIQDKMKPYSNPLNKQHLETKNAKERKTKTPNTRKGNYCKASYHLYFNFDSIFVSATTPH